MAERGAGAVIASMRRLSSPPALTGAWWLLTFAVAAGTNLLDFLTLPAAGAPREGAFVAAAILRVLLVFWIGYALARRMAGVARPAMPTPGYLAYLVVALLFTLPTLAAAGLLRPLTAGMTEVGRGAALFAVQVASALLLLRLLAWQQSLAIGDRLGFGRAWRGLAGGWPGLAAGLLAVVPVAALHLALTVAAIHASGRTTVALALALADGVVSTVQLVLMTALGVTAWAIARDEA